MIRFKDVTIESVLESWLPCEGKLRRLINLVTKPAVVRAYAWDRWQTGQWLCMWRHPVEIKSKGSIFETAWDGNLWKKIEIDLFIMEDGGVFSTLDGVYQLKNGKIHQIVPEERVVECKDAIKW